MYGSGRGPFARRRIERERTRRNSREPDAESRSRAPRIFIATVDGGNSVVESREDNNTRALEPAFLVTPALLPAVIAEEEDERATFVDGVAVAFSRMSYGPNGAPSFPRTGPMNKPIRAPEPAVPEVEPEVLAEAQLAGPQGEITVLIHAAHGEATMPRLPDLNPEQPRLSPANGRVLARRFAAMEAVRRERRAALAPLMASVAERGGRIGRFFSVGWSFQARIPVAALDTLAQDSRIRSIESIEAKR